MPSFHDRRPTVLLFCGKPGTLKTFLSSRLSSDLGWAYVPTRVGGEIPSDLAADELYEVRRERYRRTARVTVALTSLNCSVVVDGGFFDADARGEFFAEMDKVTRMAVHCRCDSDDIRRDRLATRARDESDPEGAAARQILKSDQLGDSRFVPPSPDEDPIDHLLDVDTVTGAYTWKGAEPDRERLRLQIPAHLRDHLLDYQRNPVPPRLERSLQEHFQSLASDYEVSTGWRTDETLLGRLQREFSGKSRVLDLCTGTGLAGRWYAERGHDVVGVDLSPAMLRRAASRLTVATLGNATKLPFIDQYFSIVLVRQCLHYTIPHLALDEATRVLKESGFLATSAIISPTRDSVAFWREFKAATQPLRLHVFSQDELLQLLRDADLTIETTTVDTIERRESLQSLESRAPTPPGGWKHFLDHMESLAEQISPESNFRLEGEELVYEQFWCTAWAKKG